MAYTHTKDEAHALIERMAPSQVSAVVALLEVMLDPVARAMADAPWDDEPVSEAERLDIEVENAAFASGHARMTSHEDLLKEFGLTQEVPIASASSHVADRS